MTKLVEFESAEVAQQCMTSWADAHQEAAARKQMPLLNALGKVMGGQYQSWSQVVTTGCVGHRVDSGSAQGTPQSGAGIDAGGGEDSLLMAELKAMRGEMKGNTEKINKKMTSMGTDLTAMQTSVIVVQSRLRAIEKEQDESELLLMSTA